MTTVPQPSSEQLLQKEYEDQRRRRDARYQLDAEDAKNRARLPAGFPTCSSDLSVDLTAPEPAARYAIDQLAGAGHIVSMPSSRKTGKTTFLANLCKAAVDDEPFLGQFKCHLSGNIGYWNCEMDAYDFADVFRRLGIGSQNRVQTLHLRGLSVPFLASDIVANQTVTWLQERYVRWWLLDPWKNVLSWNGIKGNDNDGVQALLERIQAIQAAAQVDLVIIPMHLTQSWMQDGAERGKGAGEFEDGVDVMWRYIRTGKERDSPRVLTVEGRGYGIGLDETEVEFTSSTGTLLLGEGDRHQAQEAAEEQRIIEVLLGAKLTGLAPDSTELRKLSKSSAAARNRLVERNEIHSVKKDGKGGGEQWYVGPRL